MKIKNVDNNIQFDGQRENEVVIKVFRRHIIAMRKGFYLLLIIFALSAIPPLIWQSNLKLFFIPLAGLFVGLILFIYHFILWYYTIFILTNQRLRQVTQKGFFGSNVIELKLSKIHNISYNIPGFSGEIFGFGTIVIQTFVGDLVINNAEHPKKIYNLLQDTTDSIEERGGEYDEENTTFPQEEERI